MAIWLIRLESGARWNLPLASPGVNRTLHCFEGDDVVIAGTKVSSGVGARMRPDVDATVENRGKPAEFLLLQGRPIGAPVFQLGPFVMNTPEELRRAVDDYRRTQFGGWPWPSRSPTHPRTEGRFAIHADGRLEHREMQPAR